MVAAGYAYELGYLAILLALLWPLFIVQMLVLRFTPKKKIVPLKRAMLSFGFFGLITLSMRVPDSSSVYGRLTFGYNNAMVVS